MSSSQPRLIAVDLNDTLVEGDGPLAGPVLACLAALRRRGYYLVLASGNSREYMRRLLHAELAPAGALPHAVICEHGAIVEEVTGGSAARIEYGRTEFPGRTRRLLEERAAIVAWLTRRIPRAHFQGNELTVCLDSGGYPPDTLQRLRARWPGWRAVLHEPVLDIYPRSVSKRRAVARLARRLGISRQEVFAMGDGLNDVELLRWAGRVAAPANAVAEVVALVRRRGGYLARGSCGDGFVEAVGACLGAGS